MVLLGPEDPGHVEVRAWSPASAEPGWPCYVDVGGSHPILASE